MSTISEAKQELKDFIDSIQISEGVLGNYDVIKTLLNDADASLFTKIIEEIKDGNLTFEDFKSFLTTKDLLNASIENQADLYNEYMLVKSIETEDQSLTYGLLGTISNNNSNTLTAKENLIYSIVSKQTDNPTEKLYKDMIMKDLLNGVDVSDSILLSVNDFIVPIDFEHTILDDTDRQYMIDNNLSEDTMKKTKAFAAYILNHPTTKTEASESEEVSES